MLQPIFNPVNQPTIAPLDSRSLSEIWWESIKAPCEWFFEMGTAISAFTPGAHHAAVLLDLELARSAVEQVAYPPEVADARRYLLNAISSTIAGIAAGLNGDQRVSHSHISKAQHQLQKFGVALDVLSMA
jgi:hypothetical protein